MGSTFQVFFEVGAGLTTGISLIAFVFLFVKKKLSL
jgi:hypothetical protein